ncbi:hypothetical protein E2C01_060188 [Portunus trituberculatus]|uniref:Uncharacterized protein n=1 Tax=Portunus trituberculatus TaxID=210409 RepID=A0A5B7H8L6_PORTR|nr:hypothetical protein [Portunus trituberculatus]
MSGKGMCAPLPHTQGDPSYDSQDGAAGRGGLQCVTGSRVVRRCFELPVRCPKAGAGARLLTVCSVWQASSER